MSEIFREYDVRGIYPAEFNEETARAIGAAFALYTKAEKLVVGRDVRLSSASLQDAFIDGIISMGVSVDDLGLVSTDMMYWAVSHYGYEGGATITASHNPKEYNGLKLCGPKSHPIGLKTGLDEIKEIASKEFPDVSKRGKRDRKNVMADYIEHCLSFIDTDQIKPLKIVVDTGNGIGGLVMAELTKKLPVEVIPLFFEPDGNFPNHPANPAQRQNLNSAVNKVIVSQADLGVAFDGDGDRVVFIDEKGELIPADLTASILARHLLSKHPGEIMLGTTSLGRSYAEAVVEQGGKYRETRIGHPSIKGAMLQTKALFAAESSGHFYYRDNFDIDSGFITFLLLIKILSLTETSVSGLANESKKYFSLSEMNFAVSDPQKTVSLVETYYHKNSQRIDHIDGITLYFPDWWFNLRASNTEPLLRLNIEARSQEILERKVQEITGIITTNR